MLDASVTLAWFLAEPKAEARAYAAGVLDGLSQESHNAVVPTLWHVEVAAVLTRRMRSGALLAVEFDRALRACQALPLETHRETPMVATLAQIAQRHRMQAADAVYFDLAKALDLPLATLDGGLRTVCRAHGVKLFTS